MIDKEQTKIMAMREFGILRMPAKAREGDVYAAAIRLVLKTDGKQYYVVEKTNSEGYVRIVKDFEETHSIVETIETYPVVKFRPMVDGVPLEKATRKNKEKWLRSIIKDRVTTFYFLDTDRLSDMDDEALDDMLMRCLRLTEQIAWNTTK